MEDRGEEDRVKCFFCGGVWHPVTGGLVTPTVRACGPCEREFFKFVKWQVRRWQANKKRPGFYDAIFTWSSDVKKSV